MGSCNSQEVEIEYSYLSTGALQSVDNINTVVRGVKLHKAEKGGRFSIHGLLSSSMRLSGKKSSSEESLLKKHKHEQHHVLLLGTSGSGKTTLMKQMRVMYNKGHPQEERLMYKKVILDILVSAVLQLIEYVYDKSTRDDVQLSEYVKIRINRVKQIANVEALSEDEQEALVTLCGNRMFHDMLEEKATKFTPTEHFFISSVQRISKSDWTPEEQDILMVGQKTTGACVMDLKLHKQRLRIVDVGGQRKERRKWPHFFEGVTAVVYCVSLAEYDEQLEEDPTVNSMRESLQLFGELVKNETLKDATIVLFFNQKDLFREKIKKTNITTAFPEYKGAQHYDDALDYIQLQFLNESRKSTFQMTCSLTSSLNSSLNSSLSSSSSSDSSLDDDFDTPAPSRPIYSHTTCAIDIADMHNEWAMTLRNLCARKRQRACSY